MANIAFAPTNLLFAPTSAKTAQQGGAAQQRAEESPLHHQREAEGESQFIFVLNEAGVGSNGDSLLYARHELILMGASP